MDTIFDSAAESAARAEEFRIKLADYMKANRPTLDGDVYDLLSRAYSLTGNLQHNINCLIDESNRKYIKFPQ